MLSFPSEPSWNDLKAVAKQAFSSSGRAYDKYTQGKNPNLQLENSPVADMVTSSPLTALAKQALPNRVSDTEFGRTVASVFPEQLQRKIGNIELGGMTAAEKREFSQLRAEDPELRRNTIELGRVPLADGGEVQLGPGNYRAKAAQAAGVIGADLATDGMRNIWWFLNAPQAVAQVAMFQGMRQAAANNAAVSGLDPRESVLRTRSKRMAAAAPAWIAASMGIGNFMRQPGYKATLPDKDDPTQTTNMAGELANRYFLGRSGSLLAYDDFVKERPDVSREEYNAYKNYLFANKSPLKGTMDGISGPEVNFMGKSIPLATGLLPIAGSVLGARRGIKRGIERVQSGAGEGSYTTEKLLLDDYQKKRDQERDPKSGVEMAQVADALTKYRKQQELNEDTVLKSVIANSAGYTTGAALSGYVLESLRRALKGRAPQYEEDDI